MRIAWVFLILVASSLPTLALDREAFTFTDYRLELRIDPAVSGMAVIGRVTLRNDSAAPQRLATLQISSTLNWRYIRVGGKAVQYVSQPYRSDIDHTGGLTEAIVTLPQPIAPQRSVDLEIGYSGAVPSDASRLTELKMPPEVAQRSDWDQINSSFSAVRGVGYVAWYPVAMESQNLSSGSSLFHALSDWKKRHARSAMRVNFCWMSAAPLTVITNGQLEGMGRNVLPSNMNSPKADSPDTNSPNTESLTGCSPFRFAPLGDTVPAFAVAPYSALDRAVVTLYYLSEHKLVAEDYVNATEKLLPFTTEWLGKPRQKLKIVEVPLAGALPFESGTLLFTPLSSEQPKLLELTVTHQLAHASFVSPRPWISEGVAHFMQALQRERQDGRKAALEYMATRLPALVNEEKSNAETPESLVTTSDDVFLHTKSMYVWWMLRDMIGDRPLQHALETYRPEADKEPSYLQRLLESRSKRKLEWFFDDWVYRDKGLPDFHIDSAYPRAMLAGGAMATVTVRNMGSAAAEVPVIVRSKSGEGSQRVVVPAHGTGVIRVAVPAAPVEAIVNDGSVPESDTSNNSFAIPPPQ